jgi:hypothetical protein
MNVVRDYERIANSESLRLVEVIRRARHTFMVFENEFGEQMMQPVNTGSYVSSRDIMNVTAQFRRFSRGQTHGLRLRHVK